jgi:hypothetical protein
MTGNGVIPNMTHMVVFDAHQRELQQLINEGNAEANGVTDKAKLCAIRLGQIAKLTELLRVHKRTLDYLAGNPYEPQVLFGEAVVHGEMGGGA